MDDDMDLNESVVPEDDIQETGEEQHTLHGLDKTADALTDGNISIGDSAVDLGTEIIQETGPATHDGMSMAYLLRLEAKPCYEMASVVAATYFTSMLVSTLEVIYVGHLGATELAAVALATMFCNVTGYSIAIGLMTGFDTLCAQAFGADQLLRCGVLLQRSLAIVSVVAVPVTVIWMASEPMFLLLGQDKDVAVLAGIYVRYAWIGLVPYFYYVALTRYLQAQNLLLPVIFSAVVGIGVALIANPVLIYWLDFGFIGAPISKGLSSIAMSIACLVWTLSCKLHKDTWGGWTWEAFYGWPEFLRLGIPGMIQLCAEWWVYELQALIAGLIGKIELAAITTQMNVSSLVYMIPLGLSVTANVRVGNCMGSGEPKRSKAIMIITVGSALLTNVFFAFLFFVTRSYWPYIFTEDEEVIDTLMPAIPFACMFLLLDGAQAVLGGVMRGGAQHLPSAIITIGCYYGISIPVSLFVGVHLGWGIIGQFIGLTITGAAAVTLNSLWIYRLDWRKASDKAIAVALGRTSGLEGMSQAELPDEVELLAVETLDGPTDE